MLPFSHPSLRRKQSVNWVILSVTGLLLLGCSPTANTNAQSGAGRPGDPDAPVAVETAVAQTGSLEAAIEYTGTTAPVREVSLRSQTEGRLLDLSVDIGDRVSRGQPLGQVDNQLLVAQVNQQRAELAALASEVAQAEAEVSDVKAQVEQARVELQQAQADANRLLALSQEGAITAQAAEQAVTAARTAEQTLRSAQERVRTRQQAVIATQGRVAAQQATLAEVQAREAFSALTAPMAGVVLERVAEPGNLLQPGDPVLRLGDFSTVKVVVQVSELELGNLRVGQSAQVRLDAFANSAPHRAENTGSFRGTIARISPAADPTARLVPIEITLPNPEGRIGGGLLARVQFQSSQGNQVVVTERAFTVGGDATKPTVFVLQGTGEERKAIARSVQIGERANGQVEIRSGLQPGDTFVVRSNQPLKSGQSVRLSILSETSP